MAFEDDIIETVKLYTRDYKSQKEVAEWIIYNIDIEFATSDILDRLISAIIIIRKNNAETWKDDCLRIFVDEKI